MQLNTMSLINQTIQFLLEKLKCASTARGKSRNSRRLVVRCATCEEQNVVKNFKYEIPIASPAGFYHRLWAWALLYISISPRLYRHNTITTLEEKIFVVPNQQPVDMNTPLHLYRVHGIDIICKRTKVP